MSAPPILETVTPRVNNAEKYSNNLGKTLKTQVKWGMGLLVVWLLVLIFILGTGVIGTIIGFLIGVAAVILFIEGLHDFKIGIMDMGMSLYLD